MQDLLLEPASDTEHPPSAAQVLVQLRQEVAALRSEVAELRRANLELRQQAGYWKGMHAQACRRSAALEQDLEQLRGENRKLQAQAFGRKSEKPSRRDRSTTNSTTPTRPRRPDPAASSAVGRVPNAGTIVTCPSARKSSTCRKPTAAVPPAAYRWSPAGQKMPSNWRSTSPSIAV